MKSIKNAINKKCNQKWNVFNVFDVNSTNYASNMIYWSIRFRDSFGTDKTSVTSADRTL